MKSHTTHKIPVFLESFFDRIKENRDEGIARRGYKIDGYALFRYVWTAYLTVMFTGFTMYCATMVILPLFAVWYASAIPITPETDALTVGSLFYVPYVFVACALLILEVSIVKRFTKWLSGRNKRFCTKHYENSLKAENN